jgi:hypothetical protein
MKALLLLSLLVVSCQIKIDPPQPIYFTDANTIKLTNYIEIGEGTPVVKHGEIYYISTLRGKYIYEPVGLIVTKLNNGSQETVSSNGDFKGMFCSAIQISNVYYVIATYTNVLLMTWTKDFTNWSEPEVIYTRNTNYELFNNSVCWDGTNYIMSLEVTTKQNVGYHTIILTSINLHDWSYVSEFSKSLSECPTIRYSDGFYYVLYLTNYRFEGVWYWLTMISRSTNLIDWQDGGTIPLAPFQKPIWEKTSVNNSDIDFIKFKNETLIYYYSGDQNTWADLCEAKFYGTEANYLKGFFK